MNVCEYPITLTLAPFLLLSPSLPPSIFRTFPTALGFLCHHYHILSLRYMNEISYLYVKTDNIFSLALKCGFCSLILHYRIADILILVLKVLTYIVQAGCNPMNTVNKGWPVILSDSMGQDCNSLDLFLTKLFKRVSVWT